MRAVTPEEIDRQTVDRARRIAADLRANIDGQPGDIDERGLIRLAESRLVDLLDVVARRADL
jgi:hypothetical protein